MAEVRVGTCSWKYPSWAGLIYSAPQNVNYLAEYATRYNTVEIDQWFWSLFGPDTVRLPSPSDVQKYRDSVPDDFRFTVKAPNSISLTHFYRKGKSGPLTPNPYFLSPALCRAFLDAIAPLRPHLGPVMFQFEYLNKQKMGSQRQFLDHLDTFIQKLPTDSVPFALEIRNGNYLNQEFFDFCAKTSISPVLIQGYWMPPAAAVYDQWQSLITQHDTVVIRLLGSDREGMEKATNKLWNKIVAPKDSELQEIARLVRDLNSLGINVYLNINNHYEGSAPLTIERIRPLIQDAIQ
ncbi:MAG: DUF72 domain-containing protein [Chloroflexi bacterium]|nr:DUF72 domain-containing protein [Chloroflexota bacterium]